MIKKFLLIFLFCFFSIPAIALTLKGNVSYSIEQAKTEAFKGVAVHIDLSNYSDYFVDKNYVKNIRNIKKGKYKTRKYLITSFSNGNYGILYKKNRIRQYYYNSNGELIYIDFNTSNSFPRKSVKYNIEGKLISSSLDISTKESYVFDSHKKLIAHWIGKNCYNEQGELIMTRE